MKTQWIEQKISYDGSQLRSLFAYMNYGLRGDSCVAWQGACNVTPEHMIDGEDLRAGEKICSDEMVHFILEKFHVDLFSGVTLQRLFATIVRDVLVQMQGPNPLRGSQSSSADLRRDGDDLFLGSKKLSISIATRSPVSTLVHFAVNVTNAGTPVETLSLQDLQIDPVRFAKTVLEKVAQEVDGIVAATEKVRPTTSF